ncbi:GntR family transcriptional regulator [Bradyrhizobium betae]
MAPGRAHSVGLSNSAASLAVARMTMHHALSLLDEEGLLTRERGRGTFVKASGRERRALKLPVGWDQVVAVGEQLDTEALSESVGTVPLPEDLGMPCSARVRRAITSCAGCTGSSSAPLRWARFSSKPACSRVTPKPSATAHRCRCSTASRS